MSEKRCLIAICSGGTGGHMSPASALASDLKSRGFEVVLITDRRGRAFSDMFADIPVYEVRSGTFGRGISGKISGVFNLGMGVLQALGLMRTLKPSLVAGFGGYPSVPGVWAAQTLKIATIIHEQNAIIGKANAFLAGRAERIALSWPSVQGLDEGEMLRAVITGNPIRSEVAALFNQPYHRLSHEGVMRILVMGGSLGARVFSDVVPETLAQLSPDYKKRLHIVQQCRKGDIERVQRLYDEAGITCELATFFDDVADQLLHAHLVIARSGASTVAEVTAAGRPAIFVPYPHHKDQQQKMNADAVADGGGAWMMTEDGFTQEALLARLETFLQNPETLFRAAEKAGEFGKPEAARKLGNLVTAIVSGWDS